MCVILGIIWLLRTQAQRQAMVRYDGTPRTTRDCAVWGAGVCWVARTNDKKCATGRQRGMYVSTVSTAWCGRRAPCVAGAGIRPWLAVQTRQRIGYGGVIGRGWQDA